MSPIGAGKGNVRAEFDLVPTHLYKDDSNVG